MYSGTTFNKKSGSLLGVHQKIDRMARIKLKEYLDSQFFPTISHIIHFEGKDGPDGIKRKHPSKDEPWHFIDPDDPKDTQLLQLIHDHMTNLTHALQSKDEIKSAFEAAWLAHAVVDGLTPAHHFPLEEKLEELRGEGKHTRTSYRKKLVIPGNTRRERLKKNWEFWGARGIMTSHVLFELGVAAAITHSRTLKTDISDHDLVDLEKRGFSAVFLDHLATIKRLEMYEEFIKKGWTPQLARQTRQELIPIITQMVVLAWLAALPTRQSDK